MLSWIIKYIFGIIDNKKIKMYEEKIKYGYWFINMKLLKVS